MTLKESLGFTVLSLLMPCVLLGAQAGCKTNQPTAAQLQPLQGTWEGYQLGQESDGKVTITITGNSLHVHRDTNYWFETSFTLPAGTDPQQLHITIQRCAPPWEGSAGKGVFAIFKIEAGTLTLAASSLYDPSYEDGVGAPKTFPSAPGGGLLSLRPQAGSTSKEECATTQIQVNRKRLCAAANGGGPSWMLSARLVAAVAELGSRRLHTSFMKAIVMLLTMLLGRSLSTNWITLTNFVLSSSPRFIDLTATNEVKRFYRALSIP